MDSTAVNGGNVVETNNVETEKERREFREQRLGAFEGRGKTMLLGVVAIGVALVSVLCSGGKRQSLVNILTTAVYF